MKYYSEKTKTVYNTVAELEAAEKELADKLAEEKRLKEEREAKINKEEIERKASLKTIQVEMEKYVSDHNQREKIDAEQFGKVKELCYKYTKNYGAIGLIDLLDKYLPF